MIAARFDAALAALAADAQLQQDFAALCDCGGRRAGSAAEQAALAFVHARLAAINSAAAVEPVAYAGWRCSAAALMLADGTPLACNALLGSLSTPPDGIAAEVVDLGRGTAEDFARHAGAIAGRFALVRHEYPFSAVHVHRRRKYGWAMEQGAAGFIIANPWRGAGPLAGSSGRGGAAAGIPAVATDFESAARLAASGAQHARVHLTVAGEDYAAQTAVVILDLPGQTTQCIALSAHVDGHDLAESAMDNATGVAVVLAVARAFAPLIASARRGLKVCLFSAEEWALAGSRQYLDRMPAAERAAIALNINLDTVGGDTHLTALTSEFPRLAEFVRDTAAAAGITLGTYAPMMSNSDHYNFARHGIPALRLVAGFDRPQCNIRHILTRGDTRDKVTMAELAAAARLTAVLLARALTAGDEDLAGLRKPS
jgi:Zn-dependent M28 family amino/carboxypeptidase